MVNVTEADFLAFIRSIPELAEASPERIVADGKLYRFALDRRDRKQSGWYILRAFDRGMWGVAGSWRSGEKHEWKGGFERLDPAQRRVLDAEIRKAREAAERAQRAKNLTAAERAKRLLLRAKQTTDWSRHEWATRKGIRHPLHRLPGGPLLVPLYDESGALVSAQIIRSDGSRRFIEGSRTHGASFTIGSTDGAETILLCEGVSTGDALHAATGLPVVCAMSAGNLEPVAAALRRRNRKANIVVCADNDLAVAENGKARNPGVTFARRAAEATGAAVAVPTEPGMDFHDVAARYGLDAVREIVEAAIPSAGQQQASERQDRQIEDRWHGLFRLDRFGLPRRDVDNIARWIRQDLAGRLVLDRFTGQLALDGSPDDLEARLLDLLFQCAPEISWTPELLQQGLEHAIGIGAVETRDSLRDRVLALEPWDGEIDWFDIAIREGFRLAPDYPEDLAVVALRTFTVGAVWRALEPGHKVDNLFVLVGPQGCKKSTWAKLMAFDPAWFADGISMHALEEKDALMQLEGVQIVELPELSGLRKADRNMVKKWITQTSDRWRPPYGRRVITRPRRFVCVATTNDETFLQDVENRRFLILRVEAIDIGWWAMHRDAIYAQAKALVDAGHEPVVPDGYGQQLVEEHERAIERDPWEEKIAEMVATRYEFSAAEALESIGVPTDRRSRADVIRIGWIMSRLAPGWKRIRTRDGDRRQWVYRRNDNA